MQLSCRLVSSLPTLSKILATPLRTYLEDPRYFTLRANGRNNSQHFWANNFRSCCVRLHLPKSFTVLNFCATTPNNTQQHAQGVQTDVTCNIQQCWKLLANNVASVCMGLKTNASIFISVRRRATFDLRKWYQTYLSDRLS